MKILTDTYQKGEYLMENKKYANRHWEQNEINKHGNPIYELHFIEYYDDEEILRFVKDKDDDDVWMYSSSILNIENDTIIADNIEDAMKEFEEMIIEHIQEDISDLEERLKRFTELYKSPH